MDVERSRLIRDGQLVPLPSKALTLLLTLLKHSGRAVEKEDLMEIVWPDSVVEDSNLTQTVHLLRKAIGKYSDSELFIETLPRFGYRLVADVREIWREGLKLAPQPSLSFPARNCEQVASTNTDDVVEDGSYLLQQAKSNIEMNSITKRREISNEKTDTEAHRANFSAWLRSFAWLKNSFL